MDIHEKQIRLENMIPLAEKLDEVGKARVLGYIEGMTTANSMYLEKEETTRSEIA